VGGDAESGGSGWLGWRFVLARVIWEWSGTGSLVLVSLAFGSALVLLSASLRVSSSGLDHPLRLRVGAGMRGGGYRGGRVRDGATHAAAFSCPSVAFSLSCLRIPPAPRRDERRGDNPRQSTWNSKAGRVVAPRITLGAARNGGEKKFILQISEPEQKVLEFFF
jgi:hypothetical protein